MVQLLHVLRTDKFVHQRLFLEPLLFVEKMTDLNNTEPSLPTSRNFIGARTGASGTLEELNSSPPVPKAWLRPKLVNQVVDSLSSFQGLHSRIDFRAIIDNHFFDSSNDRYRIVWSKNMITAAGVSKVEHRNGKAEIVLHLRDGEEERGESKHFLRQIIEGLYAKGGRAKESVEDFLYLIFVHEASELQQRKQLETLIPNIKAEIRAEIEVAKAYFSLSEERRKTLKQLFKLLDSTADPEKQIYSRELVLFETMGEENLGTIKGLLALIEFVLASPDYGKDTQRYNDERTKLQLARSLFVDILHDFAGSSEADSWVREVESADVFTGQAVAFNYTENSDLLSQQAEPVLNTAARILHSLNHENSDSGPSKTQKKKVIDDFNKQIAKLAPTKRQLSLNEVLNTPAKLKEVLEDNSLNRHFSYMDEHGIYHSLNLSRLDLRGLNLHSGYDERSASDKDREINQHKDERTDLRGAHLVGSDVSERANFSAVQMDFAIASYSNFAEVIFTRTKAIGMVLYGANANEAQFEHARMTAVDARGMSASFARIQMKETDINGMKIWQSDVPSWQRAYVDISQNDVPAKDGNPKSSNRESLKAELDFLEDSFLDELEAMEDTDGSQGQEKWIELREVDGQLELLKGRGVVFYSRDEKLEYSSVPNSGS